MNYRASYHSIIRMEQRQGMKEEQAKRQIKNAMHRGKRAEEFSSWEHNYLATLCNSKEVYPVAYNGGCYIFTNEGVCVTMHNLPKWFGKKKRFDGKEKIKNAKKYFNNYTKNNKYDLFEEVA